MDAQKRMLLAFILIILVLVLYQAWVTRIQKGKLPPPAERPGISEKEERIGEQVRRVAEAGQISAVEEGELLVETDLLRVVVTNVGIKSLQLKGYEGLGGGWIEGLEELKTLSKKETMRDPARDEMWRERIEKLDALGKELRKGYKGIPTDIVEGWVLSVKGLVSDLRVAYLGVEGELEEILGRIEKLPSWLENNHSGWVELIPYGERVLSFDLPGLDLRNSPFMIERRSLSDGERVSLVYELPSGQSLTEELTFKNGSYLIQLRLVGGEFDSFRLNWGGGLAVTEENSKDDLGYASAVALVGKEFHKENLLKLKQMEREKGGLAERGRVNWVGLRTKYFLACLIPQEPDETEGFEGELLPSVPRISERRAAFGCMPGRVGEGRISVTLSTRGRDLSVYTGPLDYDTLRGMEIGLEKVVDLGWGWISPISRGILALFKAIYRVVPNYGVVIITFSCLMMVVFFPLTRRSLHQMQQMQRLQPKVEALRKKLQKEPQKMNVEMMKLYREHRVNPLGGCLPLIFQMPVFFALFSVLRSTIELRRAGFVLWIDDLSMPDTLCYVGDFAVHVLPVLMLASMMVQQRFTVMDPRQKAMTYMMPIMFTFIFWNFPAGLVLYWLSYNILSTIQHWLIRRREREGKGA